MTFRPYSTVLILLALSVCAPGCTNLLARRAIVSFSESLQSDDLEKIRATTSDQFASKALRKPEAVNDLKMMRVPKGDVEIISMEEVNETTKKATVQVGTKEQHKIVDFQLKLDPQTSKWVVDDVVIGQLDDRGKEIRRSVTEQMDLLLSCREFMADWHEGSREVKLSHCTEELRTELDKLPPTWFNKLTADIVGTDRRSSFRPDARLNGDRAVVRVPHTDGSLFIEFHSVDGKWKAQNLAVEPKDEDSTGVRSLAKLAASLNQTAGFLTAFAAGDSVEIEDYSSPDFYSRCLMSGDFQDIPLPLEQVIKAEYESKQFQDHSELLLESDNATYMVTLRHIDVTEKGTTKTRTETRVDELTIFEEDGKSVKKVSAILLSNTVVNLFVEALLDRDLKQLRQLSSNDFNNRVWKREAARHFVILPYPAIDPGEPEVFATAYRGDVTEISVEQGSIPMTFVLRLSDDMMVVDDVIIPDHRYRPSLKANLEMILPIYEFASAVQQRDVDRLIEHSGNSLDQIVWKQLNFVPDVSQQLVRPLMSEVVKIRVEEDWTTVHTSDGVTNAEIRLVGEGQFYRIHDIVVSSEQDSTRQMAFLGTLRSMISEGILLPNGAKPRSIMHANVPKATPVQTIQQTSFEPIEREVYEQ
ncbi:hypothetical protein KOR42_26440 [Thalassoglobus neptunius]|uniref:Lumazine-binding domain protein n=1 Tax=Thalassoglobus neptunius TaxID=1938619 RepID=A0A5C5X104_9PLAN|nr:hypothetical protein [Thalassoglobus neptunius]TWT55833.1 hypothetical protein KOR42_26440 [Thalassoglobus neptunius]